MRNEELTPFIIVTLILLQEVSQYFRKLTYFMLSFHMCLIGVVHSYKQYLPWCTALQNPYPKTEVSRFELGAAG